MLPAIETRDVSEGRCHCRSQAIGLTITVVGTFDVSGLNLAAMVDDGAGGVNERLPVISNSNLRSSECPVRHKGGTYLSNVNTTIVALAISENDKDASLTNSITDAVHLR